MGKLEPSCIAGRNINGDIPGKTIWWFLKKLNTEVPWGRSILLLGIYPRELKGETQTGTCTLTCAATHNSQKAEVTQVPISRRMDTVEYIYIYHGILFGHQKEWNSVPRYNRDETWGHDAKLSKPDTKRQILYASSYRRDPKQADGDRKRHKGDQGRGGWGVTV